MNSATGGQHGARSNHRSFLGGAAALVLLVALIALFWHVRMWRDRPELPSEATADVFRYYLPNIEFSLRSLREGRLPLWNPYEFLGMPMFATLEYGPLYPLNVLYFFWPLDTAQRLSGFLHNVLVGAFAFLYLRHGLRVRVMAAAFGALCLALCAWVALRATTAPDTFRSAVYIPLILLLADRLFERPSVGRATALGGALALQFLAGETEIAARTGLLLGAYGIVRLCGQWRSGAPARTLAQGMIAFVSSGVLAVGFAAVQLLPTLEVSAYSPRTTAGLTYQQAFGGGVGDPATLLKSMVMNNPGFQVCFVGVLPLCLAVYALTRKRAGTAFFLILALITFGLVLGENAWVSRVFYYLPTGSWFRAPVRFMPFLAFAVAAMAAIGMDHFVADLFEPSAVSRGRVKATVFALLASIPGLVWGRALPRLELLSAFIAMILLVVLTAAASQWGKARVVGGLGALALLAGHAVVPVALYSMAEYNLPAGVDLVGVPAQVRRFLSERLGPGQRVYVDLALKDGRRVPKFGTLTSTPCINGFSPFMPSSFWRFIYDYSSSRVKEYHEARGMRDLPAQVGLWGGLALESGALDAFNVLGVRFVITGLGSELRYSDQGDAPLPPELAPVLETGEISVYENRTVWPRAFVVQPEATHSVDTLREAVEAGVTPAQVLTYSPHRVVVQTPPGEPAMLVLTDQWYPGWRAYVNGEPRPIETVVGLFRGVSVGGAGHEVAFRYRPARVFWGAAFSALTLAGTSLAMCRSRKRSRCLDSRTKCKENWPFP